MIRAENDMVDVLVVSQPEVARLLDMGECMDAMAEALAALARGDARVPLRQVLALPDGRGALAAMPAWLGTTGAVGLKAITVFPGNHGSELDAHQGAVLLFESERGRLVAIVDATAITAIRTAAVSGVATRTLAREDARTLGLLGTGVQASTHLEAMLRARPFATVRVWSRDPARVAAFVSRAADRFPEVDVRPARAAREAVEGADVVCTATAAREPVLRGEWLSPGCHVNAVGASVSTARELDGAAVARGRLFVEARDSAEAEAGDYVLARLEGSIGDGHIQGELGEVLAGLVGGRRTAEEITIFKSVGLAVEDVAAASLVHGRALAEGAGRRVAMGGAREEGEGR